MMMNFAWSSAEILFLHVASKIVRQNKGLFTSELFKYTYEYELIFHKLMRIDF